ncbi:MAG: hypothetical protein QW292_03005 [Candidatus Parvarchaeota archaeon]
MVSEHIRSKSGREFAEAFAVLNEKGFLKLKYDPATKQFIPSEDESDYESVYLNQFDNYKSVILTYDKKEGRSAYPMIVVDNRNYSVTEGIKKGLKYPEDRPLDFIFPAGFDPTIPRLVVDQLNGVVDKEKLHTKEYNPYNYTRITHSKFTSKEKQVSIISNFRTKEGYEVHNVFMKQIADPSVPGFKAIPGLLMEDSFPYSKLARVIINFNKKLREEAGTKGLDDYVKQFNKDPVNYVDNGREDFFKYVQSNFNNI